MLLEKFHYSNFLWCDNVEQFAAESSLICGVTSPDADSRHDEASHNVKSYLNIDFLDHLVVLQDAVAFGVMIILIIIRHL